MWAHREAYTSILLRFAAIAVALVAIATMPVCLDASNAPILADGHDVQTITEARDVVEVMDTPGVYLLHVHGGAGALDGDRCSSCSPVDPAAPLPLSASLDDHAQRVAVIPAAIALHAPTPARAGALHGIATASLAAAPALPPPRTLA